MNLNFRGSPREEAEFHFDDRKKLEKCRSFQVIIKYSLCAYFKEFQLLEFKAAQSGFSVRDYIK